MALNNMGKSNSPNGLTRLTNSHHSNFVEMNQLFKVPKFDSIPVRASVKVLSPRRKVQLGRVNDVGKPNQRSNMSFRPRSSFMNPAVHHSRTNLANTKKELIKKMIYMAEVALKENRGEIKHSTPVKKPMNIITPKKRTPRPSGYCFIVPDLKKKTPKMENFGTPIQNILKRPVNVSTLRSTPCSVKKNQSNSITSAATKLDFSVSCKQDLSELSNIPNNKVTLTHILHHCQSYNTRVIDVFEKIKKLEECFEKNIKDLPDYKIYEEFCLYQEKKEELYNNIRVLEYELNNAIKSQKNIGCKLKEYVKQRQEIFDQRLKLHKGFEEVVREALEKCEEMNKNVKGEKETSIKVEEQKPKLRRSLRLSRIPRKVEEKTPMTKKLKKLDPKSRKIQKGGSVKSPRLKVF